MAHKGKVAKALVGALSMLTLFLLAVTIKEFMSYSHLNDGAAQNTITVTGTGDIFVVPDIATFTYSVDETGATVAEAQNKATTNGNAVLKYLKDQGIEDKDIQTTAYNANPQYDYSNQTRCITYPCPPSTPKITGYEVSESVTVKVRNTDKAGAILAGVGSTGAKNLSGLTFTSDNQDSLNSEARAKAIDDAKAKAKTLASQLGVRLGKISSFSENSGGYPQPVYAMKSQAMDAMGGAAAAPEIATGQNKVTSTVEITYTIK